MAPPPVTLFKFDPDSPRHVAELRRQRVLCGWGEESVDVWLENTRAGDKGLYWIFPTTPSSITIPKDERMSLQPYIVGPPPPNKSFQPIGHVSLDRKDYADPPDLSLANPEDRSVTLATFFILASQQGKGLGNAVMSEIESLARSPAIGAKKLTLNTISAYNATRPEFWASMGLPYDSKQRVNQHWYERKGYIPYKDRIPRYKQTLPNGTQVLLEAVFMAKDLD